MFPDARHSILRALGDVEQQSVLRSTLGEVGSVSGPKDHSARVLARDQPVAVVLHFMQPARPDGRIGDEGRLAGQMKPAGGGVGRERGERHVTRLCAVATEGVSAQRSTIQGHLGPALRLFRPVEKDPARLEVCGVAARAYDLAPASRWQGSNSQKRRSLLELACRTSHVPGSRMCASARPTAFFCARVKRSVP